MDLPESGEQVWTVEVDLEADGTGTLLTFRQQLGAGWDAADIEGGWAWYLDKLRAALAGRADAGLGRRRLRGGRPDLTRREPDPARRPAQASKVWLALGKVPSCTSWA